MKIRAYGFLDITRCPKCGDTLVSGSLPPPRPDHENEPKKKAHTLSQAPPAQSNANHSIP